MKIEVISSKNKKILKELWTNPKISKEEIMKVFPEATWYALVGRAKNMDLRSFGFYRQETINFEYYKKLMSVVKG